VPSPQSTKHHDLLVIILIAKPETLRVLVGVPEDVPKKIISIIIYSSNKN
jgi:hypothetical protein